MVFQGQDAWRKHPLLYNQHRRPLPGLGTAIFIFTFYVAAEKLLTYRKPYEDPSIKWECIQKPGGMPHEVIVRKTKNGVPVEEDHSTHH